MITNIQYHIKSYTAKTNYQHISHYSFQSVWSFITILYLCQRIFFRKFNSQFPMVIMFLLGSSQTLANKQKLKWTVYARGNLSTSFFFPTEENQINKFGLDVRLMTMLDYAWNVLFYWLARCTSMSCQEEFICHYFCVL